MKKRLVVLSGAGISADSGLKTFRDHDGLWEGYRIEEVATPEAWRRNAALVQKFYNERRKSVVQAEPNAAHFALAELERDFEVIIITQNIDDLHERAGSSTVIHLHGEIMKSRSTRDPRLIYDVEGHEIKMGDLCEKGSQLRPHIVWFGEAVPMMDAAVEEAKKADVFLVVGTSLVVYPAAGLVGMVPRRSRKILLDPRIPDSIDRSSFECIEKRASEGSNELLRILRE